MPPLSSIINTAIYVIRRGDPFDPLQLYQRIVSRQTADMMVEQGRAVYPTKTWQEFKMPRLREDGSEP